jgi:hypothetical protein
MKATLLGAGLAMGLSTSPAYAQGLTVTFSNNRDTAVSNVLTMDRVIAGTTFQVALYYMPDGPAPTLADMDAMGIQLGASGIIAPAAGLYAAGNRTLPSSPSAFAWIQIRAWESAFGTSYEQARENPHPMGGRLALVGTSNIFRVKGSDPVNNPPPDSLMGFGLQSFWVSPVPEPATVGIAILGVMALLLFRRRSHTGR